MRLRFVTKTETVLGNKINDRKTKRIEKVKPFDLSNLLQANLFEFTELKMIIIIIMMISLLRRMTKRTRNPSPKYV